MKTESSGFSVSVTINSNQYKLQYLGCWGNWGSNIPMDIAPDSKGQFTLNDNSRGGIWYRALEPGSDKELGFVTMSFICAKLSDNSAEGSNTDGDFISAGLQRYSESGHPLNLTYNVGNPNLACWSSGSSNNCSSPTCNETNFGNARAKIRLKNPNGYTLKFGDYWNDNGNGASNWYWAPNQNDVPPAFCERTLFLIDNDRAGLFLRVLDTAGKDELGFSTMSFTNPKLSSASAEGSPTDNVFLVSAGLQSYDTSIKIPTFSYIIGRPNSACWNNPNNNDGIIECYQTIFKNRTALIVVNNRTQIPLIYDNYWNNNAIGKSNWFIEPNSNDSIPEGCRRYFVLKSVDRSGLYFSKEWLQFHLSFHCALQPIVNSAEGSPHSGLQSYSKSDDPVTLIYNIGTPNLACWRNGSNDDGKSPACKQTLVLPFDLRRWMGKLNDNYSDKFKNQTLRNLFIPGTHDAACYSVFMTPWGQTQELDFHDQLMKGVRYLDLRPNYVEHDQESPISESNFFHHGPLLTTCKLENLINQIDRFYTEDWANRQNEIIILDFTHFQNYMSQDNWNFFFNSILNSSLNPYLIPQGTFGPSTTLNSLWTASTNQRVIASLSPDAYRAYQAMQSNKPNLWNGANLFAPGWNGTAFWPNTNNKETLILFLSCNLNSFASNSNMWMLQDILTASPTQSVYSLVGDAREALYGASGEEWRSKANIVIQDYYDERTTIEAIIENIERL